MPTLWYLLRVNQAITIEWWWNGKDIEMGKFGWIFIWDLKSKNYSRKLTQISSQLLKSWKFQSMWPKRNNSAAKLTSYRLQEKVDPNFTSEFFFTAAKKTVVSLKNRLRMIFSFYFYIPNLNFPSPLSRRPQAPEKQRSGCILFPFKLLLAIRATSL